jgi:hypothetical protein
MSVLSQPAFDRGSMPLMRTSVASAEQLFEPRIYANRLLGRKINFKDIVIMKNVNGKIVTTVKPKNENDTST